MELGNEKKEPPVRIFFIISVFSFSHTRQHTVILMGGSLSSFEAVQPTRTVRKKKENVRKTNRFQGERDPNKLKNVKRNLRNTVHDVHNIYIDDLSLKLIGDFLDFKWVWNTLCDKYKTEENGLKLINKDDGDSCWNRWAYTSPIPTTGIHTLKIKIDKKRPEKGWLGIGVVRKKFVETTKEAIGGFKIYSREAIFVDPSWAAHEAHFNLKSLDIPRQSNMKQGDLLSIIVNNDNHTIFFYVNDEPEPFAEGNWDFLKTTDGKYEQLCGYAILTSYGDQVSLVL